ncbi:MAG: cytochrome P450 [Alphaproteobacteria bacterium]|nr:cytochrome P450 [Alphaproteobacteria bacterium]
MPVPVEIAANIVDPKAYADEARLHEAFRWLRHNMPVGRIEIPGYDPFLAITRHADILTVERQNEVFHNGDRPTTLTTQDADQKVRKLTGGSPHLVYSLVQMDNPDHFDHRRLTQAWFLPQNIRKLEDGIRDLARQTVDKMAALGENCDFARDIAFLYPLRVIMQILGVPPEDEPRMLKLTQELFGTSDPEMNRLGATPLDSNEMLMGLIATVQDFTNYFEAMTEDRRAHPREDVASVIANGRIKGEPLSHRAAMGYYMIVAAAGHDTTSNTTAGGLWALAENPSEFAKLKSDLSLIPSFVEESIRWVTPVKHFMRSATVDTEIAGQPVAKGEWLMLCYPSGNRDETVFDEPFAFKVDRTPNKQIAFGYGAHVCLGQHLARMEMRILWEELLPRLKSVELNGAPRLVEANFVSGPKSVPIRYVME